MSGQPGGGAPPLAYNPPDAPLEVIHHDSQLLVVNKPAGILSVPGRAPELQDCLLSRAQAVFPDALLVHRLDLETSGVILFALTRHAQRHLGLQFERRKVRKSYVAEVWGKPAQRSGRVDLPLVVDWPNRPRQKVCHETGRPACTEWRVLRTLERSARVRLHPLTGRSHQLRVHMLSIGHPILGDSLYAEGEAFLAADRLMLHSEMIRLRHPEGGRGMVFRSPCPF